MFWNIVKHEFIYEALGFLNHGQLNSNVNLANIVLIPKVDGASRMQDFRPISLCTILARTISKATTFRLQAVLDKVISHSQSVLSKVVVS